jgi:exonuclease III
MAIQIANLNINALTAPTRVHMLGSFLHQHDIDILLVQEVTHQEFHTIPGYSVHYNIGTHGRGNAIMCKNSIDLINVTKIPSGRAIAARFQDLWITNVYAPSGTAKKPERERFFASALTYILAVLPPTFW